MTFDETMPDKNSQHTRWYEEGLRFECTGCGDCCRNHGDYTYVYLADFEVDVIAYYLGLDRRSFVERFCEEEDGWIFLKNEGPHCLFLEDGRCRIYNVRPVQCRTWPFWSENLTAQTWHGPVRECCPGIGRGRLYSADEIEEIAQSRNACYGLGK